MSAADSTWLAAIIQRAMHEAALKPEWCSKCADQLLENDGAVCGTCLMTCEIVHDSRLDAANKRADEPAEALELARVRTLADVSEMVVEKIMSRTSGVDAHVAVWVCEELSRMITTNKAAS